VSQKEKVSTKVMTRIADRSGHATPTDHTHNIKTIKVPAHPDMTWKGFDNYISHKTADSNFFSNKTG